MKEKVNEIIDKIGIIFLCIIILLLNIYIGSNIKEPIYIVQMLGILFGTIYVIVKKIVSQEPIFIKGKIDIFVLLLIIATVIPMICKSYTSFSSTYNFIIKYICMYAIYIITRNVVTTKKRIHIISNMFMISSIIVIVFAIDFQYFKILEQFMQSIQSVMITSDRLGGPFGYPNTMALYMAFNLFMAFQAFGSYKNKCTKIGLFLYAMANIACIILTNSRSVIVIIALIGIVFLFFKYRKKITKKLVIIFAILLCISAGIICVLMQFSDVVKVVDKEKVFEIRDIKPNQQYVFKFDIFSKTQDENRDDIFAIEIIEVSRYLSEEKIEEIKFSTFEGTKELVITPSHEMSYLKIKFMNKTKEEYIIKTFQINDKQYILNYRYVPNSFARFFKTLNFSTRSVWQRGDFYFDAFKIVQENWLLGGGGNTWRYNYERVQEYYYGAKEAHSYPLEIAMSFGVLGFISFIMITAITISSSIQILKEKHINGNGRISSMIIGTILILFHSCIDFNMSFLLIFILMYMMIAIINQKNTSLKVNLKWLDYVMIALLIGASGLSIKDYYVNKIVKDDTYQTQLKIDTCSSNFRYNEINQLNNQENLSLEQKEELLEKIKKYIQLEPNMNQQYMYHIYISQLIEMIKKSSIQEQKAHIDYIIYLWENQENIKKFRLSVIIDRAKDMQNLAEKLLEIYGENKDIFIKEDINQICKVFIEQYPKNMIVIEDYKRNNSRQSYTNYIKNSYKDIYENIVNLMKNVNGNL